jgi:hypothetical protein
VLCQYKPWTINFNCKQCDKEKKKLLGCKRPKKKQFQYFGNQYKCICDSDPKCEICKGKNLIQLKQCPMVMLQNKNIGRLLPFFFHFKGTEHTQYPDGRGRIFQPVILLEALNICGVVAARKDKEEMDALGKR